MAYRKYAYLVIPRDSENADLICTRYLKDGRARIIVLNPNRAPWAEEGEQKSLIYYITIEKEAITENSWEEDLKLFQMGKQKYHVDPGERFSPAKGWLFEIKMMMTKIAKLKMKNRMNSKAEDLLVHHIIITVAHLMAIPTVVDIILAVAAMVPIVVAAITLIAMVDIIPIVVDIILEVVVMVPTVVAATTPTVVDTILITTLAVIIAITMVAIIITLQIIIAITISKITLINKKQDINHIIKRMYTLHGVYILFLLSL